MPTRSCNAPALRVLAAGVVAAFAALSAPAAASADAPGSFFEGRKEGWFWYQDPPAEPEEVAPEPPAPPVPPPEPQRRTAADYPPGELWSLHPEEFQTVWRNTLNAAVQDPSEGNVLVYKEIEAIARLRATRFASVASLVSLKHPELSTARDAPSANPGLRAKRQVEDDEIAATLSAAREDFALLSFQSEGCRFCAEQAPILEYFAAKHGWPVKPIDVDREPHVASLFRVRTTPTLLLIYRRSEASLPVAVGVVALPQLERNVFRGVRLLQGQTAPEDLWMYEYQRGGGFDPAAVSAGRFREVRPVALGAPDE